MILLSAEEVANARRNVTRFPWARAEADAALEASQPFLARSDEELWSLVTGQQVPRGIHVNPDLGCPSCGRQVYEGFGNYPWKVSLDRPFQLECPSCGEVWPKNDFAAFHQSGLGPGGVFDRPRADASLLHHADHPDPGDPLHGYAVDDGMGWTDGEGNRWWFVAYYSHYCTWTALPAAVTDLSRAYLLTGDPACAHKAAVLLDRIADVYPDMNLDLYSELGLYNSHGGSGKGRLVGCIWETGLAEGLARACDLLMEAVDGDDDLVSFLGSKAREWDLPHDKSTPEAIRQHWRDHLLREFIGSCRDFRIRGNEGMTHTTMATSAAVLDDPHDTPEALDWLFLPGGRMQGGGHIPATLIGQVDRDGVGNEAAPGYCFIWMDRFARCAEVLGRCRRHRDYDLFRDYPRLRRMQAVPYKLTVLDRYTPNIGDSGSTGSPGMRSVSAQQAVDSYARLRDPWFGQLAHKLNGGVGGLHTAITDAEPHGVQTETADLVERLGELELDSANLNGYGLALFRSGSGDDRRAAWLYYGRNTGHGHRDRLNYGLYYRGMDVLPDLGYPEYADGKWPKRAGWTVNTVSHNTVVVDARKQDPSWVGRCHWFAASAGVSAIEVGCAEVYPEAAEYRRTLALVDLSRTESYLVDLMRVTGGADHVASFHSGDGTVTSSGLDLVAQGEGTYAGPDIPFGQHYDGAPDGRYVGSGFAYLYEVERAARPESGWWVDWDLADTWGTRLGDAPVHLRYHGLSPVDEVALAWGDPPRNKPGNPRRLRYVLQRRQGADVRSLFAAVIEPYSGRAPNLAAVERLDLGLGEGDLTAAGLRIEAADGRVDRILSSDDVCRVFDLGEGVCVAARFAVVSRQPGGTCELFAVGAVRVELPEGVLTLDVAAPACTGTVADFHREEAGPTWVDVQAAASEAALWDGRLTGAHVKVHSRGPRDCCYTIDRVEPGEGGARLWLGDTSLIRGSLSETDYEEGFLYDFEVGDRVEVPTLVHVRVKDGEACELRATAAWEWSPAG